MTLGEVIYILAMGLFVLAPAIGISITDGRSVRARVLWSIVSLLPIPLALGLWILAMMWLKPAAGIHSSYSSVAALLALAGPWGVLWVFRARTRKMLSPNPTVERDARHTGARPSL